MPEMTPKLGKQHPVPQHIAAFEFKLIGDLTIKQFLFAGVGIAVCYAAWISDLNFLVKWGIILTSAGLGLGTAFFPIQDRTLDQWLLNFVLAIFSPTQRLWRKEPLPPEYLREDYSRFLTSQVLSMTPIQSRRKLQQYLGEIEEKETMTGSEGEFIEKLNFDIPLPTGVAIEPPPPTEPKKEKLPELKEVTIALEPTHKIPLRRNITPGRKIRLPTIEGTIRLKSSFAKATEGLRPLPERKIPAPSFAKAMEGKKEPIKELIKENGRLERMRKQNIELQTRLEEAEKQLKSLTELKKERSRDETYSARLLEQEREVQKLTKAVGVPPVVEKRIPNIISGIVKDREGKLLENTVVIIKDQDGDPVRALKTNGLGQFAISTPLENGKYTVEISSKERNFDIMGVTTDGSVLSPVEFGERYG